MKFNCTLCNGVIREEKPDSHYAFDLAEYPCRGVLYATEEEKVPALIKEKVRQMDEAQAKIFDQMSWIKRLIEELKAPSATHLEDQAHQLQRVVDQISDFQREAGRLTQDLAGDIQQKRRQAKLLSGKALNCERCDKFSENTENAPYCSDCGTVVALEEEYAAFIDGKVISFKIGQEYSRARLQDMVIEATDGKVYQFHIYSHDGGMYISEVKDE